MELHDEIEQTIANYAKRESETLAFPDGWKPELEEKIESAVVSGMNLIAAYQCATKQKTTPQRMRQVISQIANKRGWDHVQLLPDE